MYDFQNHPHAQDLDARISDLLEQLKDAQENTEQYTAITSNLVKLMNLRDSAIKTGNEQNKLDNEKMRIDFDHMTENDKILIEKDRIHLEYVKIEVEEQKLRLEREKFEADQENRRSWKPSPDAVVTAAASVVSILFVLHYEKIGVVTSKALGFVGKLK